MDEHSVLEVENLGKTYIQKNIHIHALRSVSFKVRQGEMMAVIGKSGSGKSTLLNILGGILPPDRGVVKLKGKNLYSRKESELARIRLEQIGYIYQDFCLIPELTAEENILLPAMMRKDASREWYKELLEYLQLSDRCLHYPDELSGGQCQRVAIARALINHPDILLCDEPTGNLDQATGREVMNLLSKLNREKGVSIVIVTHDMDIASCCERCIRIADGSISL